MRKTFSIVALLILILTSCSSADPTPTPIDVPAHAAAATATPPPTATPQPTKTPLSTATATTIGPNETQIQEVLANAEVVFSADTTNTFTNESGFSCTLKYSDGILEGTGIDYVQFPKNPGGPMEFMCNNLFTKVAYVQRSNDTALSEAFKSIPADGNKQNGEVYDAMVTVIEGYMQENGSVPVKFKDKNGKNINGKIIEVELNSINTDEFWRLSDSLDNLGVDHFIMPDWAYPSINGQEAPVRNDRESSVIMFLQNNKLTVYLYDKGPKEKRNITTITMSSGIPLLENLHNLQTNKNLESTQYTVITQDYIDKVFSLKIALVTPSNYAEYKSRLSELQERYTAGSDAFTANHDTVAQSEIIHQTFNSP